jgi:predicted porin
LLIASCSVHSSVLRETETGQVLLCGINLFIFYIWNGNIMKKAIALATCLAASALGAHAQSTVQVTGLADVYVGSKRMAGDTVSKNVADSGGMTTSWWGMMGSEDLGDGLKASFALTAFFRMDTGDSGRFTGDTQFSRDANVSLSGSFGTVNLGRGKAPNFLPTIAFNPIGDSFTFSPLVLHADVPLFNVTNWKSTVPSDTGWSNQITYTTPDMAGLKANIHYQLGEIATDNGKNNLGLNLMYFSGPLGLTAYWERDQVTNPTPALLTAGGLTRSVWMVGGSYDATVVKGFMTYGKSSSDNATVFADRTTLSLGLSAPVGSGKVLAAYAKTDVDNGNTRDTFTVGYDYNLSKRTDLYAMLMSDKITTFESGTSLGLGVRHRF